MEIVNKEKEKADKAIAEIEAKCGQKIEEFKEEQRQQLMRIEDEHTLLSIKGGGHPHPSNIGDLFSEGSLNPYAEDPYAFD
ncbi:hypothetical protein JHK85_053247 [Glycine max]|nr:hypothetical protein JHK87_052463 [Glycine soja]KAG4926761.1 hypothetical protein JHK85_053247 [Glycine max]